MKQNKGKNNNKFPVIYQIQLIRLVQLFTRKLRLVTNDDPQTDCATIFHCNAILHVLNFHFNSAQYSRQGNNREQLTLQLGKVNHNINMIKIVGRAYFASQLGRHE